MRCRTIYLFAIIIFLHSTHNLLAKQSLQTPHYLQMARDAWELLSIPRWKEALLKADRAFQKESAQMSEDQRNNAQLWLTWLWSKYYQYQGIMPPVRKISEFKEKGELQRYIKELEEKTDMQKKAVVYLRNYNRMFYQLSQRNNLNTRIQLEASRSLERDLQNSVRQAQIYIAFLTFAAQHWQDKKKLKKRLREQDRLLKVLRKGQFQAGRERSFLKKQQKQLALAVKKAHFGYNSYRAQLRHQATRAKWFIIIGSGITVLGTTGLLIGLIQRSNLSTAQHKNEINDRYQRGELGQGVTVDAYLAWEQNVTLGVSLGFAGLGTLGLATVIVGIATYPTLRDRQRAVLKSHSIYLKQPATPKKQSLLHPRPQQPRTPIQSTQGVVLGRW